MNMNKSILTVSQLNFYIKTLFEDNSNLKTLFLQGEISNLTDHYSSGHIYLSIKDEKSVIKAVMFKNNASKLKFKLSNGMKILVRGQVSVYEASGQYQFYIDDIQPDGIGALNLAFEQLKDKLFSLGLFDSQHKKSLPKYPQKIGVITSPAGAAIQDILRILKRRYPIGEVVICPVLVQGEKSAFQLTQAIKRFNKLKCADVIIIGRGGGSIEDLWAFNDENLAMAIYNSKIPVVSAVGHETDFTICDFVADVRASTPSAAAELVSPEYETLLSDILNLNKKINTLISSKLEYEKNMLNNLVNKRVFINPFEIIEKRSIKLDMCSSKLNSLYKENLSEKQRIFSNLITKLDALSPFKVMARGYSIVKKEDKIISSVKAVNINEDITVNFSDGSIKCTVTERNCDNEKSRL